VGVRPGDETEAAAGLHEEGFRVSEPRHAAPECLFWRTWFGPDR
jgi:hypothetical protein